MKAGIYNPYLDTLGGGERYTAAFANVLVKNGYEVDIEWKNSDIKNILTARFGIDLSAINIVEDIKKGDGYDLCFWVTDGSVPLLHSRRNILHFQVPFHMGTSRTLLNKMKLFRINKIVCNSLFTKRFIDKEYGVDSIVIYPPVDTLSIKPKRKENIILFVGRFSKLLQSKGQDVLVKAFKKMCDAGLINWKLILAGGTEVGAIDFVEELKKISAGYPVEIFGSPDYRTLKDLYGKAKIFWSASGYGQDELKNPETVEHFGITVVEAMAAGAIPVVYSAGGHKEIVVEGESGMFWTSTASLINKTRQLMNNSKLMRQMGIAARKSAEKYSEISFEKNVVSHILQK